MDEGIMVFKPDFDEFKNFDNYIKHIESQGAHKSGLAKIIPPKEWVPRRGPYSMEKFDSPVTPIAQIVTGKYGVYDHINVDRPRMTVEEYCEMATSDPYEPPNCRTYVEFERQYWKNITYNPPIYAADIPGTLFDSSLAEWNLGKFRSVLDLLEEGYKKKIAGINSPYLYFGMWRAMFPWHTEDMDLYSINFLHFGAPKFWYSIPPAHGKRFEEVMATYFPELKTKCSAFLRHKTCNVRPSLLKTHGVPYHTIVQLEGELIVTFPYGYHSGFNLGYNCAESTNFATERWVEYGKLASRCLCKTGVWFDMDLFVKKYQPERYNKWIKGKDLGEHPEYKYKPTTKKPAIPTNAGDTDGDDSTEETMHPEAAQYYIDIWQKADTADRRKRKKRDVESTSTKK